MEHAYADVNGVRLHYVTAGAGPLIVFVHGFPEFWYMWRRQLEEFARDHQAVAPDMRGYNPSSKPADVAGDEGRPAGPGRRGGGAATCSCSGAPRPRRCWPSTATRGWSGCSARTSASGSPRPTAPPTSRPGRSRARSPAGSTTTAPPASGRRPPTGRPGRGLGGRPRAPPPAGARALAGAGHRVGVGRGGGGGSGIRDDDYATAGAEPVGVEDVWQRAELVLKVKEPLEAEYGHLRAGQVLFTYLHLAQVPVLTRALRESGGSGIAHE